MAGLDAGGGVGGCVAREDGAGESDDATGGSAFSAQDVAESVTMMGTRTQERRAAGQTAEVRGDDVKSIVIGVLSHRVAPQWGGGGEVGQSVMDASPVDGY